MKLRYLRIFLSLIIIAFCCGNTNAIKDNINISKVYIHQVPSKELVNVALNIVIDKLNKEKIYTKQQMLNVINNGVFKEHNCTMKHHHLIINFTMGKWSKKHKRYCIFSEDEDLKGMCLIGLFNGYHKISMLTKPKIHQTAFAHELLHYFRRHIDGPSAKGHEPEEFWERLVGFEAKGEIGILNEELRGAGL